MTDTKSICLIDRPGIYPDIPMPVYTSDPCPQPSLSAGCAWDIINDSPLHAWSRHPRYGNHRGKDNGASDLGSAAHLLVLGGDTSIRWVDAKDWRTKDAKAERDAARAAGQHPLLTNKRQHVESIAEAATKRLDELLPERKTEQTIIWEASYWGRARADAMWHDSRSGVVVDLKTSATANPEQWAKRVLFSSGHHIRAAHYCTGLEHLTGVPWRYLFMVQEIEPPFATSVIELDGEAFELAKRQYKVAAELWSTCVKSDSWPGYQTTVHYAELPGWARWEWEGDNDDV